jgi:prepilin-type N-terminal cleavage/methylation domain-containing protein
MNIENKWKQPRVAGFTLVEIMVVVAIIGLLMSVATVGISHAVKSAQKQTCAINIEGIEGAKSMWMLENKKGDNDVATEDDLKPILKNGLFPTCPSGGTYSINANNVRATCSVHGAAGAPTGSSTTASQ